MKKITDAFKKIFGPNTPKDPPIKPEDLIPVYVKMEHFDTLMDENKIKEALKGKLKGKVGFTICFCEPDFTRSFSLTDESDFEAFATAMKTIPGVLEVIKGEGPGQKLIKKLEKIVNKTS